MNLDFDKTMKQMSDAELIKITNTDRNGYQEAALLAAENELRQRKLSQEQISVAIEHNEQQQALVDAKANAPLEIQWKILAMIFPVLFQLIISGIFKGDGYHRKSRELLKWTLFGILLYIVLILSMKIFG